MKRGKTYFVPHRRKREGKTDYKLRLRLLKSGKPRFAVRKSSSNTICQVVRYSQKGDTILVSADSKELKKFGWLAPSGNTPAAYLTGLLCGKKAGKEKISQCVLDIGLYQSTNGSRLYSALKGALDSGIKIPHSKDILPDEKRTSGQHISEFAAKLKKENPEKYKKVFSQYLKKKIPPEDLPKHFALVKGKIIKSKK